MAQSVNLKGKLSDYAKSQLQKDIKDKITSFQLVNTDGKVYHQDKVEKVFYDKEGVLTTTFMIPFDKAFKDTNKYFRIVDKDDNVLTEIETPAFIFDFGFGGVQTVKFPIKDNPGQIVLKNTDYIDRTDMDDIFLPGVVELSKNLTDIQNNIFKSQQKLEDKAQEIQKTVDEKVTQVEDKIDSSVVTKLKEVISDTPKVEIPDMLVESQAYKLKLPDGFTGFEIQVSLGEIKKLESGYYWYIPMVSEDKKATISIAGIQKGKVISDPFVKEVTIKNIPVQKDGAIVNTDFVSNEYKSKNITF